MGIFEPENAKHTIKWALSVDASSFSKEDKEDLELRLRVVENHGVEFRKLSNSPANGVRSQEYKECVEDAEKAKVHLTKIIKSLESR